MSCMLLLSELQVLSEDFDNPSKTGRLMQVVSEQSRQGEPKLDAFAYTYVAGT